MRTVLMFTLILLAGSLTAQNTDATRQRFTDRLIEGAKERAQSKNLVLVVMENKNQAAIIFVKPEKFKGVEVQLSRKRLGMSVVGAEFMMVDKRECRLAKYDYPERFHSCYADFNTITLRKDELYMERAITVKSTTEFFERFYSGNETQQNTTILLDLKIYDYGK